MSSITIHQWDHNEFASARERWQQLLSRSSADRLFLCWDWQYNWWKYFSDNSMQLKILVACDPAGKLVGIAPLYLRKTRLKGVLPCRQLQLLGNIFNGASNNRAAMPTEHLEFIVDTSQQEAVCEALWREVLSWPDWHELALSYINTGSATYTTLDRLSHENRLKRRANQPTPAWQVDLSAFDNYQHWLSSLGKNTRLRVHNRRQVLESLGKVTISHNQCADIDTLFGILNKLHEKRWHASAFEQNLLDFNRAVAAAMADYRQLDFSLLYLDDTPVSIQYNISIDGHCYNLQAGFDASLHKKISPGYLHFGYAIENCFQQGDNCYDLLAGDGKHTEYKSHLSNARKELAGSQFIRSSWLKLAYAIRD